MHKKNTSKDCDDRDNNNNNNNNNDDDNDNDDNNNELYLTRERLQQSVLLGTVNRVLK